MINKLLRSVFLALLLAGCVLDQSKVTLGPIDPASVKVSGSVNRDFERAVEYLEAKEYPQAIVLLEELVEREQRLAAPYINLAIAYYRAGQEKKSEQALHEALKIVPRHPAASNELAVLYRRQGRFEEARAIYSESLLSNADNLSLIKNYGILCDLYLQDLNCALKQFKAYHKFSPDTDDVKIWIADLEKRASQ